MVRGQDYLLKWKKKLNFRNITFHPLTPTLIKIMFKFARNCFNIFWWLLLTGEKQSGRSARRRNSVPSESICRRRGRNCAPTWKVNCNALLTVVRVEWGEKISYLRLCRVSPLSHFLRLLAASVSPTPFYLLLAVLSLIKAIIIRAIGTLAPPLPSLTSTNYVALRSNWGLSRHTLPIIIIVIILPP